MKTDTRGGLLKGLGRKLAGESLFMTTYTCTGSGAMVAFTPEAPGKIMPFILPRKRRNSVVKYFIPVLLHIPIIN